MSDELPHDPSEPNLPDDPEIDFTKPGFDADDPETERTPDKGVSWGETIRSGYLEGDEPGGQRPARG